MSDLADREIERILSFFERLHRKAPGSEASTRRALSMLTDLPPQPDVVEFGCGSGTAAMVLAAAGAHVTAMDLYQPYLAELEARAAAAGVAERIRVVQGDMADPPLPDLAFDLVWSEGAIYLVGFETGLKRWRRLLRKGGYIAVTEATWISPDPPQRAVEYWAVEYPAMTGIQRNLATLRAAGFEPVGHFVLPPEDWSEFLQPLEAELAMFRNRRGLDEADREFATELQQEIDLWQECGDSYGYVFYLGRAR